MKLHHMARESKKDDESDSITMDGDKYPHGLKIHLDHEEMNKIGMKDTPTPGDKFHMEGRARVTDAHEPADGSKEGRHATLHFTHMGAEGKADQKPEKTLRDEIKGNADEQEKGKGQPKKEPLAKAQDRGKDAGESAARAPRG